MSLLITASVKLYLDNEIIGKINVHFRSKYHFTSSKIKTNSSKLKQATQLGFELKIHYKNVLV